MNQTECNIYELVHISKMRPRTNRSAMAGENLDDLLNEERERLSRITQLTETIDNSQELVEVPGRGEVSGTQALDILFPERVTEARNRFKHQLRQQARNSVQ